MHSRASRGPSERVHSGAKRGPSECATPSPTKAAPLCCRLLVLWRTVRVDVHKHQKVRVGRRLGDGLVGRAVEDAVEDAGPGFAPHGVDDPESGEAADAVEDAAEDAGPGFAAHGVDDPESGRPPSSVEAAAGAVKDYVKDEVKGKAEGLLASHGADELVDTPDSTQVLAQIFIFFAQKLSLQVHVNVNWPRWYLRVLSGLAFLQLDVGGLGSRVFLQGAEPAPIATTVFCPSVVASVGPTITSPPLSVQ